MWSRNYRPLKYEKIHLRDPLRGQKLTFFGLELGLLYRDMAQTLMKVDPYDYMSSENIWADFSYFSIF